MVVLKCLILGYFCKNESVEQSLVLMTYFEKVFLCYFIFLAASLYVFLNIFSLFCQLLQVDISASTFIYLLQVMEGIVKEIFTFFIMQG